MICGHRVESLLGLDIDIHSGVAFSHDLCQIFYTYQKAAEQKCLDCMYRVFREDSVDPAPLAWLLAGSVRHSCWNRCRP